jgi:DnaJ-class molecular chaperone
MSRRHETPEPPEKRKPTSVNCYSCGGKGMVPVTKVNEQTKRAEPTRGTMTCPTCGGMGWVKSR